MDPVSPSFSIEIASKLGGFLASVLGGPLEEGAGVLKDRLTLARWERQNRLIDRYSEVVRRRGLQGKTCAIAPKFVVPIIEAAALEDNDSLQDMWAELLATASDPSRRSQVRSAFIDILRQIEPVDAAILMLIYRDAIKWGAMSRKNRTYMNTVDEAEILEKLVIDRDVYRAAADNLMRLRLITSFVEEKEVVSQVDEDDSSTLTETVSRDHRYETVSLTIFGSQFVAACMQTDTGAK